MDRGAQEAMRNQMGLDLEQAATGGVLRGRGEEARGAGGAGADSRSERGVGEKIDSKAVNRAAGAIKQARAGGAAGLQALGRLKAGTLNKTEQAYEALLKEWQHLGIVAWFKFEGVKLRLADNTFYTPDFAVMLANGQMELHEVKGARAIFADDAKVKVKIAAELYPFPFVVAFPVPKNRGGGWEFDRYE